jgi:hypothetical protein
VLAFPLGSTMALIAYGMISIKLLKWRWAQGARFRFRLAQLCGLVTWWSLHLAMWRISIVLIGKA